MDLKEFVAEGYLQEVNRLFFHPLGLALSVAEHDDGRIELLGFQDARDDPEGWIFSPGTLNPEKALKIAQILDERRGLREGRLGYWVQPIPYDERGNVIPLFAPVKEDS
jgi:hypothetical protein